MLIENHLRKVRQTRGISMSRLARQVGIAESALCEIELGKRLPWPKARADLARVLGVEEVILFPFLKNTQ
jgi:transcriptional regulator with XRE-family HTH domain